MHSIKLVTVLAFFSTTTLLAIACSSTPDTTTDTDAGTSAPTSDPVVQTDNCVQRCGAKATECGAPASVSGEQCKQLCSTPHTESQLTCLSAKSCTELAALDSAADFDAACKKASPVPSSTSTSTSSPGKFGDPCKCKPDSESGASEFECSGTGICSTGLSCVGSRTQGVDRGTCVGPVCCSSESDCAAKLGTQSNCATGQQCTCPRGDLECVGTKCTCVGGYKGTRGLCHKK